VSPKETSVFSLPKKARPARAKTEKTQVSFAFGEEDPPLFGERRGSMALKGGPARTRRAESTPTPNKVLLGTASSRELEMIVKAGKEEMKEAIAI